MMEKVEYRTIITNLYNTITDLQNGKKLRAGQDAAILRVKQRIKEWEESNG